MGVGVKTGAADGKPPRPERSGEIVTAGFPKSCVATVSLRWGLTRPLNPEQGARLFERATVPGLSQAHVLIVELSKEREGNGVGVLGKGDGLGADPLAFPFVDHHADILPLRLVLGVRCEYAGIDGSGRRHGHSDE
jgi:hypothetical protein